MKRKQVPMDSPEWVVLDRQVQVTTGKSSIKLISAFKFDDATASDPEFGKNKDKNWIDATINMTDFSKQYYRQVLAKEVALEDLILFTGHINIHKYSNQPYKTFNFIFCKVHLGTAGSPDTPKAEHCDSLIIQRQNDDAFQYNFFVKHHWQYQIKYEVNFALSDEKEFDLSKYSCCNCENRTPSIYCSTEKLYFCEECCNDHHKAKLMHSHLLEAIDKVNTLENCRTHNQKSELYCLTCEKYLCAGCIQKGVHAQGTDHIVKPIRYYYSELTENIQAFPKKSQQKIEVLLYNLSVKRKEIEENEQQVRLEIEKQYKRCLKLLEEETAKKIQLLDSCELELSLMKDKIAWNQSFSVFQSTALKPIFFFKAQAIFEEEIKKIKVPDFDAVINCKPNIIYKNNNIVGTKQSIDKNQVFKKQVQIQPQVNESRIQKSFLAESSIKNEQRQKTIFSFDPQAQAPPRGSLMMELSRSNLNYFQLKAK